MQLVIRETREVVASEVKEAYTFAKRLKGLMFTGRLPEWTAIHLAPCTSVHTFFMKYAIDVVHMDDQSMVTGVETGLKPGKLGKKFRGTHSIVELPAGTAAKTTLVPGQILVFEKGEI
ncbi:DUF192 domain-containing protein [Alteribacillus iranensis]|uniref:DUF192 domain-containing protein n=1 Tax=Alteribacillus iranensis TaxID=930128 RepID=A0A1I2EU82_9BACI|nr:DUF192 domain-containing protein [Alteribacillus iranensis]SFE96642.1 hypothetical protein SAMN05192532_10712 [Alteribacillus iranensis]